MTSPFRALLRAEQRRQRGLLLAAGLAAACVVGASTALLGLSGWFITGAALAGIAGAASFNYMLPSATIRLLAITRTAGRYGERVLGHEAALRGLAHLRPALFLGLARGPAEQALRLSSGEAVAHLVQDVDEVEADFIHRTTLWSVVAALACGIAFVLPAGTRSTVGLALLFLGVIGAGRVLAARLARQASAIPAARGEVKDRFASLVAAAPELCVYGLQDWARDEICDRSDCLIAAQRRVTAGEGWLQALLATSFGAAGVLVLATSQASLPITALATLAAATAVEAIGPFLRSRQRRGAMAAAIERLDSLMPTQAEGETLAKSPLSATPSLGIASITLACGDFVGLRGRSGLGKTTLLEQFAGLRTATDSDLCLDGTEIEDVAIAARRGCFAYAPQDAAMLAGTVRDNLLLGDPSADDASLWAALHDAALDGVVAALPDALNSWIGDNGCLLSGGERRRLGLARAYLRAAPWLLLDEPTEGLDAATEAMVVERLHRRAARLGQGLLIASHRPAPLAACTVIVTLKPHCSGASAHSPAARSMEISVRESSSAA